jgi:hypothetical protein
MPTKAGFSLSRFFASVMGNAARGDLLDETEFARAARSAGDGRSVLRRRERNIDTGTGAALPWRHFPGQGVNRCCNPATGNGLENGLRA